MKRTARINFHSLLLTCLALVAAQTHAVAEEWPKNVDVSAQNLFAPVGFDDNDEAIVVIDGYLPSACHRLLDAQVTFKPGRKIVVAPRAREFKGVCPDVVVPFTQVVKLGQLSAGDYLVMSLDGRQLEKLNVKRATLPGPDDFLYAPVDRAWVNYPSTDRWTAVLEGRLTNSCLKIVETKIELTGTTIQLLPIMKFIPAAEGAAPCRAQEKSFRIVAELPYLTNEGRYLLHVRSLNGQSVNEVFYRTTPQ